MKPNKPTHTMGPWKVGWQELGTKRYPTGIESDHAPRWSEFYSKEPSGQRINICQFKHADDLDFGSAGNQKLKAFNEANANLIAAAPEMLDILEQITKMIDQDSTGGQTYDSFVYASGIQTKIDQVIAKARGEL